MTNERHKPVVPDETHAPTVLGAGSLRAVVLQPAEQSAWSTIRVVFDGDTVFVTGDAFDWTFRWFTGESIVEHIPRFNASYIEGKLVASSTRCEARHYDTEATVATLREFYGESSEWDAIEDAAREAVDARHAIQLLYDAMEDPGESDDLVTTKTSPQLAVAIRAVQMAAKALNAIDSHEQRCEVD